VTSDTIEETLQKDEAYAFYVEKMTPKYFLFTEWDKYREGDFEPAMKYALEVFHKYVRAHWRKRVAKKILKKQILRRRRGRIFKEFWNIHLELVALEMAKKFGDAFIAPGLSEKILPKVTVELIEDPPANNPG
jgi:hypothetical protein